MDIRDNLPVEEAPIGQGAAGSLHAPEVHAGRARRGTGRRSDSRHSRAKAGGGLDARYRRDYMESFKDPEGYAVSHRGWGLHPRAHWTALGMYDKRQTNGMDARSFWGNFMFSTGPNAEGGGSRHTPCHLDIPMMDCSVEVDGVPMVVEGQVTMPHIL